MFWKKQPKLSDYKVSTISGLVEFRGDKLEGTTFNSEHFVHHRYFSRKIRGCRYVSCRFEDLRMWDTQVCDTEFFSCDLRNAALGGLFEGRVNRFERVAFEKTDLRKTAWSSAEFIDCQFIDCRLDGVDFQRSRFSDCKFVGELREVMFYDHGFSAPSQPPNELKNCDFSHARLETTAFRRLDLLNIIPPLPEFSVTIPNYREFLQRGIHAARPEEKVFCGMCKHYLKWAGANQQIGFFGIEEIEE